MGALDGKVTIISGAARGQGAAEARLFESRGAKVMLGDILDDEGAQVLINNAGIITPMAEIQDTSLEQYNKVVNVNQVGVFLGMREVVKPMQAAGGGSIVNISSIDGLLGMHGAAAYCATKFAVRGMTKVAAIELGKYGIRVNSIHPGGIETQILDDTGLSKDEATEVFKNVPLGRIGQSEEMATLAAYLASDDASYSTGSEFIADGGMTAGFALEG